jgi:RNA polymerase sigma factor (sigma-70 family)
MDAIDVGPGSPAGIVEIIEPLGAYVRSRARSDDEADDIVQESLTRVLSLNDAFTPDSALAYAIVVARNLLTDGARDTARTRRLGHRVIDRTDSARPVDPETAVLRREERLALRAALAQVPVEVRQSLLDHVLDDVPVTAIADATGESSGAVGARMARIRAKLRLDYLLALRGVELPTVRCRPILLALSAGDTRRQSALRAGSHLIACSMCAQVSEPLLQRSSALATILPWLGLGPALLLLRSLMRQAAGHPVVAAGTAAATTAGTVGAVMIMASDPSTVPPPPVAADPVLMRISDGASILSAPIDLRSQTRERVRASAAPVLSVAADEGFWVGTGTQARVWVQLRTAGQESPVKVKVGDAVTFTGEIVANGKDFAREVGVSRTEGAALLTREGAHLSVDATELRVSER